MRELTSKDLARRMLRIRDNNGPSFAHLLRTNGKRYLYLVVCCGVLLAVTAYTDWWTPCAAIGGVVFGCLLRDFGWVRNSKKTWPFSREIIDWQKVEKLADEKATA